MKVKLEIGYEQLMAIIQQLSTQEVNKLREEIDKMLNKSNSVEGDDLENFIANGPVMDDEQYRQFEENRTTGFR